MLLWDRIDSARSFDLRGGRVAVCGGGCCGWKGREYWARRVLGWVWARLRIEAVRFCWLARGGGGVVVEV